MNPLGDGGRHKTTLDNLMEGFQLISFDWRYLYVNDAVVKQSKYSRDELLGHSMMEKYPGIEQTDLFRELERCMKERAAGYMENEFTFPDGTTGWFELSIQPVPDGIFILSMDITARKKAEQEKAEYVKGLENMVFMTQHRVRQPVTQILGCSHLLEESPDAPEDIRMMVGYIKQAALSLDTFTRELTAFMHEMHVRTKK